uniref:BTB domain-containing protein n=1 Tax=Anopheles melas TaxID=34690 RepID=A0A182TGK1_9DIPT
MRIIMQFLYYGEATIFDGDLENVVAAAEHLDLIPVVAMLRNLGKEQQQTGHHRSAASYLGYEAIASDQAAAATPPRLSVRSQYMAPHNRKRIAPDSDDEQLPERLSPVELTMAASRDLRDPSGAGTVQTPMSPQRPQATNPPPEQLSPGLQEGQTSHREPDLPLATREATVSPHTTSQSSSVDERDKLWSYYDSVGLKLLTDSAQSTPIADADRRKATAGRAIVGSAGKSAPGKRNCWELRGEAG